MASIPWTLIHKYTDPLQVDPVLIAAIGQHETAWGDLGVGQQGYQLGYGIGQAKYQGLENQIKYATQKMAAWGMSEGNVSLGSLQAGNLGQYKTGMYGYGLDGSLTEWPAGVWRNYQAIKEENAVNYVPDGSTISNWKPSFLDRVIMWKNNIQNPKPGSIGAGPVPGLTSKEQQESYNNAREGLIARGYIDPLFEWPSEVMKIGVYILLIIIGVYAFSRVFQVDIPMGRAAAAALAK